MNTRLYKGTKFESAESARKMRGWKLVDAKGKVVGRLASEIAVILRGKTKPQYSPHNDCGDFVVVVNADKVKFTGDKVNKKFYYSHSGYVGNLKSKSAGQMLQDKPERVITAAVQGMLPKNPLGRAQLKKLKVYAGETHPHAAQLAAK
jgi:large subunit ribosomal protein L13